MANNNASIFPNSGIQHSRAVVALTITQMCMETFKPDPKDADLAAHMDKICKAVNACAGKTRKKRFSAGAKRDIDNCCITLSGFTEGIRNADKEKGLTRWCELNWCALTFIEDVLYTCPQYTDGLERRKWKKLHSLMLELTASLQEIKPGFDEFGTYIYECCAWAMDGVVFKLPEYEGAA